MAEPTPLARHLMRMIEHNGPMSVATYMAEALGNPQHGYYTTGQPFGRDGDFITSPEISQIFGELIGLWFADLWDRMNRPPRIDIVEIGPGRGTLMADLLRAARKVRGFCASATVHMVETSPTLQKIQRQSLIGEDDLEIKWHSEFSAITQKSDAPLFLIANELFDALPIRQFQLCDDGWHERMVTVVPDPQPKTPGEPPSLGLVLNPAVETLDFDARTKNAPRGAVLELSSASEGLIEDISRHLLATGGVALFFDYGPAASSLGDSLQAVRKHEYVPIFAEPGKVDLTAHVNFARLAAQARQVGGMVYGPCPQGAFLREIGIEQRAAQLIRGASASQKQEIESAVTRLISPQQMGSLFKAMAVTAPGTPAPAGFPTTGSASLQSR